MLSDMIDFIQKNPQAILTVPVEYLAIRKNFSYPIHKDSIAYYVQRTDLPDDLATAVLDYLICNQTLDEIKAFVKQYPSAIYTRLGKLIELKVFNSYTEEDVREHISQVMKSKYVCYIDADLVDKSNEETFRHLFSLLVEKYGTENQLGILRELKNVPNNVACEYLEYFPQLIKFIDAPTFDQLSYVLKKYAWNIRYTKASSWKAISTEERHELMAKYLFPEEGAFGTTTISELFKIHTPTREDVYLCIAHNETSHSKSFELAREHGFLDNEFVGKVFLRKGIRINVALSDVLNEFVTDELLCKLVEKYGALHVLNEYNSATEKATNKSLNEFLSKHSEFFSSLHSSHERTYKELCEKYLP